MANYTKSTDFAAKDTLPGGDSNKVVRGTEFETEFDAISTAIATKSDIAGPTFTGTVTIPTVDINAGAIDGTVIGASSAAAGTFTNLVVTTADINGGTIDGATIGGSSAGAGTFTNLTASGTVNFNGATISNLGTITTANLDGGTADNVVIGGSTPAAGSFTTVAASSSITVGGTAVLTSVVFSNIDASAITTSGETFADSDTQIPTNAAVKDHVEAVIPSLTVTEASVTAHQAALAITASQLSDVTSTATELNLVDGSTADTVVNSKAVIYGAAGQITANELDVDNIQIDANAVKSTNTNGNIQLFPNGTGFTELYGNTNAGAIRFNCESNSHGVTLKGPPHSAAATYSLELPNADGSAGQFLKTDGSGKLSFATVNVNSITGDVDIAGELLADSYNETFKRVTSSSNATTLNCEDGNVFEHALTENTTFTFSNPPASGTPVGYQIGSASYTRNFSVSSQDTDPVGIAFNTDGTKMFIVGQAGQDVNEYTLSTGFNVSTASFVDSFSVASQDTVPQGIAFNADGTKMFIVGYTGSDINEYTLSTGFDVSTSSFVDSFSVSSQDNQVYGVAFNTNGTKMFVVGAQNDSVYEYTLSTGFDVSTASYDSSFSVTSQDTVPVGITFNNDGTKMYIVGFAGKDINEYTLSTAFDVSTASYSQNFSVNAQETSPYSVVFNADGTKMFVVGNNGDDVNEYSTGSLNDSTAYALSLKVVQDSSARTITWPTTVDWPGGTAPTLTATSGGVDVFVFFTFDGGSNWYGFTAGQALA